MRKIERIDAREITMEGLEAFGFARVGYATTLLDISRIDMCLHAQDSGW